MTIKNFTPQLRNNCLKLIILSSLLLISSCTKDETLSDVDLESTSISNWSTKSVELQVVNITADNEQSDNPATDAIDNDPESRWSGFGDPINLTLDLGLVNLVDYVNVAFHKGDVRTNYFEIFTSTNGSSWNLINGKTSNGQTEALQLFDLTNTETRYLRLKCFGNSISDWNSILDIEVYGTPGSDEPVSTDDYVTIPAKIQAEDYSDATEGRTETKVSNNDGTDVTNVGWIDSGESLFYDINVPSSGTYTIDFRLASRSSGSKFDILKNGSVLNSVSAAATGDWYTWANASQTVQLSSGNQTIEIKATGGGWNIDWLEFKEGDSDGPVTIDPQTGDLDPNKAPSENFDLSKWYLSVPIDNGSGLATSIRVDDLNDGYELNDYFFTDPSTGGMVFRNYPKTAKKTSSSTSYTRTELREMLTGGSGDVSNSTKDPGNNWWFSSSNDIPSGNSDKDDNAGGIDGILTATLKVNRVTQTSDSNSQVGRIIIGQIHASKNEPNRLYYHKQPGHSKGAIYVCHEDFNGNETYYNIIGDYVVETGSKAGDYSGAGSPSDGIALNEEFSYKIEVVGNDQWVTISRPGKSDITQYIDMSASKYDTENDYMYFKAGVYSQNKSCKENNDYDQVTFYALNNSH